MYENFQSHLCNTLDLIRSDGFYKEERVIDSPQADSIRLAAGQNALNFCANNYLGLSNDERLIEAAKQGLNNYGFGMALVRLLMSALKCQAFHQPLNPCWSI
ncbi:hypothetical protein [Motiliproteus sp. MSK22-1]|uniref:hypothetical protein n=1 Tax=Motiliproteus sp. MSK22-1 TaxID=1897630 RepID=UPI00097A556E|nr:hypothetical protein [Motiliproteus sp. MSK22-1]OMH30808.1 hypothetical protein BGP75_17435 [Motiliproteus sp. MSK22-1]